MSTPDERRHYEAGQRSGSVFATRSRVAREGVGRQTMTYKLTCPGCDRYLSVIFRAYENGDPCPCCGHSLSAASEQYYRQLPDDHGWVGKR